MKNKKKNELAKIALSAFMISAALPAAGHASDAEAKTLLAGGKCRAGGCGAATRSYPSETDSSKNGSTGTTSPKSGGCGASNPNYSGKGCGASTPKFGGCGAATNNPSMSNYDTTGRMNQQGRAGVYPSDPASGQTSSYQGTTTGPGPNDGYPATPRGYYETQYKPSGQK
jgi:hypothetical protein